MKKGFLFLVLFATVTKLVGQTDSPIVMGDTLYYKSLNGFIVSIKRPYAEGFGIAGKKYDPFVHTIQIFYLQSETKMAEYEAYDTIIQNKKDNVKATLKLKHGAYKEWYIDGKIKIECNYVGDKLDGEFKLFYPNGNIKRREIWKRGEWQEGECFDENNKKTEYCSYHEEAEFVGGLPELYRYIGNNIKYPSYALRREIEGVVYILFIIEQDGSVTNVRVYKGVEEHLDQEALRVIKAMPKWKPARFEGSVIRTEHSLPIRFRMP